MLTFGELASFFEASSKRAKAGLVAETETVVHEAADYAKSLIGEDLPNWPPLAEKTIIEKQRLGFGGQVTETDPLLRTGQLRDSITGSTEATSEGAEGVVGSTDDIAAYQEMGTSRGIPPRPFLSTSLIHAQPRIDLRFGELAQELLIPGIR